MIGYLVIKFIAVAHDGDWLYLATGWGEYFMLELGVGVVVPLILFAMSIRNNQAMLARIAAFITVFGIALNRLNTALIAFNWKMEQEIPHWRELAIVITIYAIYFVVYRFILYRLPILYTWKEEKAE